MTDWLLVGECVTQCKTWVSFPSLVVGDLNLVKIRRISGGFGTKFWLRSFYPSLNIFSDRWEAIYPKNDFEFILLANESIFKARKQIQVLQSKYSSESRLELFIWTSPIDKDLRNEVQDLGEILRAIENLDRKINQTNQNITNNTNLIKEIEFEFSSILPFISGL